MLKRSDESRSLRRALTPIVIVLAIVVAQIVSLPVAQKMFDGYIRTTVHEHTGDDATIQEYEESYLLANKIVDMVNGRLASTFRLYFLSQLAIIATAVVWIVWLSKGRRSEM